MGYMSLKGNGTNMFGFNIEISPDYAVSGIRKNQWWISEANFDTVYHCWLSISNSPTLLSVSDEHLRAFDR